MRVYNFSAGPAMLPEPVLQRAQDELLDWDGSGMSVMEVSHRSKEFIACAEHAEATLRAVMGIPDNYKVLHFFGFAAPTLLTMLVVRHWWPALVFAAHAVISELVQAWLLPGRDGDIWDVAADLSGVLAAVAIAWWLQRRASSTADSNPT